MNAQSWIRILQQHYPIDVSENRVHHAQKSSGRGLKEKGPHPKRSAWNVHKFGGSTFENADSYAFVASLINNFDGKNLVVVSALSGLTNILYAVCRRAKLPDWQQSDEWINLITKMSSTIKKRLGESSSGLKETQRVFSRFTLSSRCIIENVFLLCTKSRSNRTDGSRIW